MWTSEARALVGDCGSGPALTDDQFRVLEPLIPPARPGGRPRTTDMRRLLDSLFYLVRTGCQPQDFLTQALNDMGGTTPQRVVAVTQTMKWPAASYRALPIR